MLLFIVFTATLFVIAFRVSRAVLREGNIFQEFNASKTLAFLVLLYPVGPIVLFILPIKLGWVLSALLATACYLPAMLASRRLQNIFERSGTDRTKKALSATTLAFGGSLIGVIYVAISAVFMFANSAV